MRKEREGAEFEEVVVAVVVMVVVAVVVAAVVVVEVAVEVEGRMLLSTGGRKEGLSRE